jgi:hypothetical protein
MIKDCMKWFCIVSWSLYILRLAVFLGFNIYLKKFYPWYFYVLEVVRLTFWVMVIIYCFKENWFKKYWHIVLLWVGFGFTLVNLALRGATDYLIYKDIDCSSEKTKWVCIFFWSSSILSIFLALLFDISFISLMCH